MTCLFFPAALLLSFPALATHAAVVPDRFVGHWAGSREACGSDADDLILRITPGRLVYWESEGTVTAVVLHAENRISLTAELHGEGDTWRATMRYTLSADGKQLIDGTSDPGRKIVRYRCPAPMQAAPEAQANRR